MIEWGEWIDDPWRLVRTDEYWDKLAAHGVRTADLMVDTSKIAWDPKFSTEMIGLFCQLAIDRDIEPVCLGWPAPRKPILDAMLKDFEKIAQLGVAGLGIDTEHLWRSSYVASPFRSLREAAEYLLEGLFRIRDAHDVRLELTTHPGHREANARATLTPHVDRFYLQSYSTRHDWRSDEVDWDDRLSPGIRQALDIERAKSVLPCLSDGSVRLCLGQALYDQRWPGKTPGEALSAALDATIASGVTSVRGWSSKWDVGVRSGSIVQQAVSEWIKGRFGA